MKMRRGEIWLANLDPVLGSEAAKTRPVIIVSNDGANTIASRLSRGVLMVVPLTSNTAQVYPFQVLFDPGQTGLKKASKAQAEQVRSIDATRLTRKIGQLTGADLILVDQALRLHLAL